MTHVLKKFLSFSNNFFIENFLVHSQSNALASTTVVRSSVFLMFLQEKPPSLEKLQNNNPDW